MGATKKTAPRAEHIHRRIVEEPGIRALYRLEAKVDGTEKILQLGAGNSELVHECCQIIRFELKRLTNAYLLALGPGAQTPVMRKALANVKAHAHQRATAVGSHERGTVGCRDPRSTRVVV